MALKVVQIEYSKKGPRWFSGWVGGTEWPEYRKDRAFARILSRSAASDVVSRLKEKGFKAKAIPADLSAS